MAQAIEILPSLGEASRETPPEVIVGRYPYPIDAMPILGLTQRHPRLYIATMHSGATLGPVVGLLVAEEIAKGVELAELAPYRPHRDFSDVSNLY